MHLLLNWENHSIVFIPIGVSSRLQTSWKDLSPGEKVCHRGYKVDQGRREWRRATSVCLKLLPGTLRFTPEWSEVFLAGESLERERRDTFHELDELAVSVWFMPFKLPGAL